MTGGVPLAADLPRLLAHPGLIAISWRGHIAAWNHLMERWTGQPRELVLGRLWEQVIPERYRPSYGEAVRRALAGETLVWPRLAPHSPRQLPSPPPGR